LVGAIVFAGLIMGCVINSEKLIVGFELYSSDADKRKADLLPSENFRFFRSSFNAQ
jgi:hypothetical protein